MPKQKTHRGAAKRIKRTGTGRFKRRKAYHSHLLSSKSPKRKRNLRKPEMVEGKEAKMLKRILQGS